jgi:hypothetical protein
VAGEGLPRRGEDRVAAVDTATIAAATGGALRRAMIAAATEEGTGTIEAGTEVEMAGEEEAVMAIEGTPEETREIVGSAIDTMIEEVDAGEIQQLKQDIQKVQLWVDERCKCSHIRLPKHTLGIHLRISD